MYSIGNTVNCNLSFKGCPAYENAEILKAHKENPKRDLTEKEIEDLLNRVDKYVKDKDIERLATLCKSSIIRSRV
jgi:hypothetical protein